MSLTDQEIQYFHKAIDLVFDTEASKGMAHRKVVPSSTVAEVIAELDDLLGRGFVARASSNGVKTPQSVVNVDNTDISQMWGNSTDATLALTQSSSALYEAQLISDILGHKLNSITVANVTITACTYNGNYAMGDIITRGDNTTIGIISSMLACLAWDHDKIDHYLTTTDETACIGPLPTGLANSVCVTSLDLHIS